MLSRLFGDVDERILSAFPEDKRPSDYDDVFKRATNVVPVSRIVSPFSSIADVKDSSSDKEHPTELDFLKDFADRVLPRETSHVVSVLFHELSPFKMCSRRAIAAQALTLVHVLKKIFGVHKEAIKNVMGDDKRMLKRINNSKLWQSVTENPRPMHERLVTGEFDDKLLGGFIYEVLVVLSSEVASIRLFTNSLISCEYHIVRCAMDAANEDTLRICALSSNYIKEHWFSYMKFYYPRMFSDHKPDAPALTWKNIVVYHPVAKHVVEVIDTREIANALTSIFTCSCNQEFVKTLAKISCGENEEFEGFRKALAVMRDVRITRKTQRKNYSDTRRRGAKRRYN